MPWAHARQRARWWGGVRRSSCTSLRTTCSVALKDFDFAQNLFPRLLAAGEKILGCEGDFYCSDIGTLEAYRTAQRDALSGKVRLKIPCGQRSEELRADDHRTRLHPTVSLPGRTVVERDVVIGRGAPWSGTPW